MMCTTCVIIRTTISRSICGCHETSVLKATSQVSSLFANAPKARIRSPDLSICQPLLRYFWSSNGPLYAMILRRLRRLSRVAQTVFRRSLVISIMDNAVLASTLFRRASSAAGCAISTAPLYNPHTNID